MGNGNSTNRGSHDFAQLLRRFREVDAVYQTAPDAEKEKHYPRRHAALMLVLGARPQSRDDISELMNVAVEELAKELLVAGPMSEAVLAALTNCLRTIDGINLEPSTPGEKSTIELTAADSPSSILVDIDAEIAKLGRHASLLGYLAKSSGQGEQDVFLALMDGATAIKDALSAAVDRLMPTDSTRPHTTDRRRDVKL